MAKDKLTEYDATAANNTVVGDVNLAENSALPSDMNNAVREVMSHLKGFASGTDAIDALTVTGAATVNGAFTSPGIDDNADATAITIDSSENVGIGRSPLAKFDTLIGSGLGGIAVGLSGASDTLIDADLVRLRSGNGTEAMRISGSNFFIGKTSANLASTGVQATSSGQVLGVTRDGGAPFNLNRLSDDGDLLGFYQDTSLIGTIGTNGDRLYFTTANKGFYVDESGSEIVPSNGSGSNTNNIMNLGNSASAFKDLYLGGNLYLGGTGSANALDDYEEGTFTPRFQQGLTSAGYSTQTGVYTKIGRQVICSIVLRANSGSENGDHIYIGGLPFTARNATNFMEGGFFTLNGGFWTSDTNTSWLVRGNETNVAFYRQNDGGAIGGTNSNIANNLDADVRIIVLYTTA